MGVGVIMYMCMYFFINIIIIHGTVHVHITYANESAQWTHCTRMFANFQSVQPVKLS